MQDVDLAAQSGRIVTSFDVSENIVRIKGVGFWTPDHVDEAFAELHAIRQTRFGSGALRVFVDRRETFVQSPETAEKLRICTETFYRTGDRVAVLVDTSLNKMQLRRVLSDMTHMLFISEVAAMIWLKAMDGGSHEPSPLNRTNQ